MTMTFLNRFMIFIALTGISILLLWPVLKPADQMLTRNTDENIEAWLGDGLTAIEPIPLHVKLNQQKIALGKRLFHDPRLSPENISCSSCHDIQNAGQDGKQYSLTLTNTSVKTNTPTIFNSGFSPLLEWDGVAQSLEEQINRVIQSPEHMASNWAYVVNYVGGENYIAAFRKIYNAVPDKKNIINAIATYERSLYTPNAPFDHYLRGIENAISEDQKSGYLLFKDYGCIACHQGTNVGGNIITRFGIFNNPFKDKKVDDSDLGYFNVSHKEIDKYSFRVPSLRNVAKTAPYFHDGSAKTLSDAIKAMGYYQLGREIPDEDVHLISEFLQALTGEYNGIPL